MPNRLQNMLSKSSLKIRSSTFSAAFLFFPVRCISNISPARGGRDASYGKLYRQTNDTAPLHPFRSKIQGDKVLQGLAADGKAATTEFVKGENGKWTLTTFAEMSNDALGSGVANGQIKVYAAPTVEGLNNASPMTSGVTVKGKKSAVMTTIEVTPPGNPPTQFFKVKFGE